MYFNKSNNNFLKNDTVVHCTINDNTDGNLILQYHK